MGFVLFLFFIGNFLWFLYKEVLGGMIILINILFLFFLRVIGIYIVEKKFEIYESEKRRKYINAYFI